MRHDRKESVTTQSVALFMIRIAARRTRAAVSEIPNHCAPAAVLLHVPIKFITNFRALAWLAFCSAKQIQPLTVNHQRVLPLERQWLNASWQRSDMQTVDPVFPCCNGRSYCVEHSEKMWRRILHPAKCGRILCRSFDSVSN